MEHYLSQIQTLASLAVCPLKLCSERTLQVLPLRRSFNGWRRRCFNRWNFDLRCPLNSSFLGLKFLGLNFFCGHLIYLVPWVYCRNFWHKYHRFTGRQGFRRNFEGCATSIRGGFSLSYNRRVLFSWRTAKQGGKRYTWTTFEDFCCKPASA